MSPLIPILIGIASQVGAPIIKGILTKHAGPLAGSVAEQVIKTVAEQAGATPETLETVDSTVLAQAVTTTEAETPELIAEWVKSQQLSNELQLAEMSKEQTWTWAWRPGGMWVFIGLTIWYAAIVPMIDLFLALMGATPRLADLLVLTVSAFVSLFMFYAGFYMGGHTIKEAASRFGGGK